MPKEKYMWRTKIALCTSMLVCLVACHTSSGDSSDDSVPTHSSSAVIDGTSFSGYNALADLGTGNYFGFYVDPSVTVSPTISLSCTPGGYAKFKITNNGGTYSAFEVLSDDGKTISATISASGKFTDQMVTLACPENASIDYYKVAASKDSAQLNAKVYDIIATFYIVTNPIDSVSYALFDNTSTQSGCSSFSDPLAAFRQAEIETKNYACVTAGSNPMKMVYTVGDGSSSSTLSYNSTKYASYSNFIQGAVFDMFSISFPFVLDSQQAALKSSEQHTLDSLYWEKYYADQKCSDDQDSMTYYILIANSYDSAGDEANYLNYREIAYSFQKQLNNVDKPSCNSLDVQYASLQSADSALVDYFILPYNLSNYANQHIADFGEIASGTSKITLATSPGSSTTITVSDATGAYSNKLKWGIGRSLPSGFTINTTGTASISCPTSACPILEGITKTGSGISNLTPTYSSNYPTTRLASHEGYHAIVTGHEPQDTTEPYRLMYGKLVKQPWANIYIWQQHRMNGLT